MLRSRRSRFALALAVTGLVAVTVTAWARAGDGPPDDRILVAGEDGAIALLDPATGDAVYEVPDATATPDRSALLTTRDAGGGTVLESRDPQTGDVSGSTRLDDAGLTVRTVSPEGTAVALMPGPRGRGTYAPEARDRTSITVSYLDDRAPRTYDLDGNVEPEMFSVDEAGLYVLEFVPPRQPDSYYVRRLDLATGEMTDTGAPQVGLNPRMRGRARASALHPEGHHLFTLYTLPRDGDPVFAPDGDDPHHAFVHVIDLEEDESFCIFLPAPVGTADEAAVGMGIAPDGEEVIVADPSTSTITRIDVDSLEVTETVTVEKLRPADSPAVVTVAPDGTVYVGAGRSVLELTPPALEATRVWSHSSPVSGLSLSADGDELRVGGGGTIALIDRETGLETAELRAPGRGTLKLLGPPQGSVTQFPLECAC